jgi:hypothetical protein
MPLALNAWHTPRQGHSINALTMNSATPTLNYSATTPLQGLFHTNTNSSFSARQLPLLTMNSVTTLMMPQPRKVCFHC